MIDNPGPVGILPQPPAHTPVETQNDQRHQREITGFAYYFPDAHPTWFVKYLGGGHEGDAVLVASHLDGKLYVRKRKCLSQYSQSKDSCIAATMNYIEHKHIPRLVSSSSLLYELRKQRLTHGRVIKADVTTELWQYCNGGDLYDMIVKCARLPQPFCPEIVIWCLMQAFISVLPDLHQRSICHSDILPCNVLLDWSSSGSSENDTDGLPVCYLADFGLSFRLPPDEETILPRGFVNVLAAVRYDFEWAARTIAYAMNSVGGLAEKQYAESTELHPSTKMYYSEGLLLTFDRFRYLSLLLKPHEEPDSANEKTWWGLLDSLPCEIQAGYSLSANALSADDRKMLKILRLNQEAVNAPDPRLILPIDMIDYAERPPGPWVKVLLDDDNECVVAPDLNNKQCVGNAMMSSVDGPDHE
jgi:hypothetical protein